MDERSQPRLPLDQPVSATILSQPPQELCGRIINISGRGLQLKVDRPVPEGTLLKVEFGQNLLLGEVEWCRAEGSEFAAGISVEHSLIHTNELAQLAQRILGDVSAGVGVGRPVGSRER